jgi:hypothetical protein
MVFSGDAAESVTLRHNGDMPRGSNMADGITVIQALNLVMKEVTSVGKNEKNVQQNFRYRGIDATLDTVGPAFRKHGVVAIPNVLDYSYDTVEIGKNRTPMAHVIAKVMYRFYGPAGDCVESTVVTESMDSGDKAMAKAMSVAFRIALLQVLAIPTGEPDPDSESYERSAQTPPAPRQARTPAKTEKTAARTIGQMVELADSAKTVEELREVWKIAGQEGHLPAEITNTGTGEKITYQNYLYQRHDELTTETAVQNLENAGMVAK